MYVFFIGEKKNETNMHIEQAFLFAYKDLEVWWLCVLDTEKAGGAPYIFRVL